MAHHGVGPPEDQEIGILNIWDGMHVLASEGFPLDPEITGKFLGEGAVVVFRSQSVEKANAKGRLEMTTLAAASQVSHRPGPMSSDNLFEFGRYFIQGLLPGDALEPISHAFEGEFQPLRVILEISDVGALPADITLGARIFPVTPDFQDLAPFGGHFQAAVAIAKDTGGLFPFTHSPLLF